MAKSKAQACLDECYSFVNGVCDILGLYDRDTCADACVAESDYDFNACKLTAPVPPRFTPPYYPDPYDAYPYTDQGEWAYSP
jgi:hypothetical protein